jgi:hypothetical protein
VQLAAGFAVRLVLCVASARFLVQGFDGDAGAGRNLLLLPETSQSDRP